MKKRNISLLVAAVILLTVAVGVTLAILVSSPQTVVNTFTVGEVNITLRETTGTEYKLAPGVVISKDPTVTVLANSEDCWLFVKIEKSANFEQFCEFEVVGTWTALSGNDGVYYRQYEKSATDTAYDILQNNCVKVKEELTEEQLNAITANPTLSFTAYAIQRESATTAAEAWNILTQ